MSKSQPRERKHVPPRDVITGSFSKKTDLISYVVTGLLIGLLLDWAFNTRPVMVIIWTLMGLSVGYYMLWKASEVLDEEGKKRSHGV